MHLSVGCFSAVVNKYESLQKKGEVLFFSNLKYHFKIIFILFKPPDIEGNFGSKTALFYNSGVFCQLNSV